MKFGSIQDRPRLHKITVVNFALKTLLHQLMISFKIWTIAEYSTLVSEYETYRAKHAEGKNISYDGNECTIFAPERISKRVINETADRIYLSQHKSSNDILPENGYYVFRES